MSPETKRSVIIIGAGVAGLSAGRYAQMYGYQSHVFEMHTLPGGLCTSWQRKGYTIDGCIHWLVGSSPSSPLPALGGSGGRPGKGVPLDDARRRPAHCAAHRPLGRSGYG